MCCRTAWWGTFLAAAVGVCAWYAMPESSAQEPGKAQDKAPEQSPVERQEGFFKTLKAGDVKKAYGEILKDSLIQKEQGEQVENLITQTEQGVKLYGGAGGWENLGFVRSDKYVAMGLGVLCCDTMPLFFYFAWYRKSETSPWSLINIWFNDQPKEFWSFRR
ncbi:MAG: hypothetical protein HY716_13070 [Planctomycetes bacterium]|nr:hypothetical protein [Planctomycetota bacterium]